MENSCAFGDKLQEINATIASTSQEAVIMWHHRLDHMS